MGERCRHGMIEAYCSICRGTCETAVTAAERSCGRRRERRFAAADIRGLWGAIGFLAARATISIVAPDEDQAAECGDEYQLATGETARVAVDPAKWGHSIILEFDATDRELAAVGLPREMLEPATRDGATGRLISNTALGWALFSFGFRVGAQNVDRVLKNAPAEHVDTVIAGARIAGGAR